jgi:hypothetical protein
MREMTGGCQCGRIRYTAQVENGEAYLCHCRMCQRATGGVSAAFKNFPQTAIVWASEPDYYASSAIAKRPFCRECGTPLGFRYNTSDRMDLTIGSFDDPGYFFPIENFGVESRHAAWEDTSHLPGVKAAEHQGTIGRWQEQGLEVPR